MHSITETVEVICSVDVLKMRSTFFHKLLCEQDSARARGVALKEARDPIILPESSPFEAAAFLESLHEGRALFKGEWNLCWARLR